MGRSILYSIMAAVPVTAGLTHSPVVGQVLTTVALGVIVIGALLAAVSTLSLLGATLLAAWAQHRLPNVPGAPPAVGLHRSTN